MYRSNFTNKYQIYIHQFVIKSEKYFHFCFKNLQKLTQYEMEKLDEKIAILNALQNINKLSVDDKN